MFTSNFEKLPDADGTVLSDSWPFVRTVLETSASNSEEKKPARPVADA